MQQGTRQVLFSSQGGGLTGSAGSASELPQPMLLAGFGSSSFWIGVSVGVFLSLFHCGFWVGVCGENIHVLFISLQIKKSHIQFHEETPEHCLDFESGAVSGQDLGLSPLRRGWVCFLGTKKGAKGSQRSRDHFCSANSHMLSTFPDFPGNWVKHHDLSWPMDWEGKG